MTEVTLEDVQSLRRLAGGALRNRAQQSGFTLIELILVIIILGVLAVYAAPRMFDSADFKARGFHDASLSLLRYAQKTAIAQRRTVCVSFTSNNASLRTASNATVTACDTNLVGPRGDTPGTVTDNPNTAYASLPAEVRFDGLGQPLDNTGTAITSARTITVPLAGKTITIEPATGYVHD